VTRRNALIVVPAALWLVPLACEAGGVGDPCLPEDEYRADFSGFSDTEAEVETASFQCKTRVCIVNFFQGRTSCPYGQTADDIERGPSAYRCYVPGTTDELITVPVQPQLTGRRPDQTVYCSCRCQNAEGRTDDGARYCACPSGYECAKLFDAVSSIKKNVSGYYCIKQGTKYDPNRLGSPCSRQNGDCEQGG